MTKNIRKVGLLKDGQPASKPKAQANNSTAEVQSGAQAAVTSTTKASTAKSSASGKYLGKFLSYFALGLLLVLILLPKPELLRYQKMNTVATSIYWPGVFGAGAGLIDSHLVVYIDNSRKELSLCYQQEQDQQCSRYQILHRGGLIDVISYLLSA